MDSKSAVAAAGALVLVIAGGTSALVAAQTPLQESVTSSPATEVATQDPVVVVEYVDEAGNPVPPPGAEPTTEIRTYAVDREIVIPSDAEPDVIWVDIAAPATASDAAQATFSGSDDRYEGDDDDRYENDDDRYEHEDDDRYEHDGGEDDDD